MVATSEVDPSSYHTEDVLSWLAGHLLPLNSRTYEIVNKSLYYQVTALNLTNRGISRTIFNGKVVKTKSINSVFTYYSLKSLNIKYIFIIIIFLRERFK